jgi:hypothetical protein
MSRRIVVTLCDQLIPPENSRRFTGASKQKERERLEVERR